MDHVNSTTFRDCRKLVNRAFKEWPAVNKLTGIKFETFLVEWLADDNLKVREKRAIREMKREIKRLLDIHHKLIKVTGSFKCTICLVSKKKTKAFVSTCGHVMCATCWQPKMSCPFCRSDFKVASDLPEKIYW